MRFLILGLLLASAAVARADEPAIIAKARACRGTEAALTAVNTIHFSGKYIRSDPDFPDDPNKARVVPVEIFFEKPARERIVVGFPAQTVETVVDGYDGWQRVRAAGASTGTRLALLHADFTENLRADAWENLNFYGGLEAAGGSIEDKGGVTIDGLDCEAVAFHHSPSIVYFRYFDRATGRLIVTTTSGGVKILEKGEIVSGGIRFPQSIVTRQKLDTGKELISTYVFDKIEVNEAMPDSLFTLPLGRN